MGIRCPYPHYSVGGKEERELYGKENDRIMHSASQAGAFPR